MERYDYRQHITSDVEEYIKYNITLSDFDSREDLEEYLNETLWMEDSVTGNASGSYTFSRWESEENIYHNLDLLEEACSEFGSCAGDLMIEPEATDVTIRCYLLGECIADALDNIDYDWED